MGLTKIPFQEKTLLLLSGVTVEKAQARTIQMACINLHKR